MTRSAALASPALGSAEVLSIPGEAAAVESLLACIRSLDVNRAVDLLSENICLQVPGASCIRGRRSVRRYVVEAFAELSFVQAEVRSIWTDRSIAVLELDCHCHRYDELEIAFPLTVVMILSGRLISELRLYTYEPERIGHFLAAAS